MNSPRRRGVGRSRHIPTSSTTTSSPRAATSPPGSSRSSSRKNFAPASSRCGNSGGEPVLQLIRAGDHRSTRLDAEGGLLDGVGGGGREGVGHGGGGRGGG